MAWGRPDLIGSRANQLVPRGPIYGAWHARARKKGGGKVRYDTHMGMKVSRGKGGHDEDGSWEAIARTGC